MENKVKVEGCERVPHGIRFIVVDLSSILY
jgi:hypothetical protein